MFKFFKKLWRKFFPNPYDNQGPGATEKIVKVGESAPTSSSLPQPLSYEQILGQALSSYAASLGINDQIVEKVSQQTFDKDGILVPSYPIISPYTVGEFKSEGSSGDLRSSSRDYGYCGRDYSGAEEPILEEKKKKKSKKKSKKKKSKKSK